MHRTALTAALLVTSALAAPASAGVPVPADYNGDGVADLMYWADGPWHGVAVDIAGRVTGPLGINGVAFGGLVPDIAVPGDFNGDGITDIGIFRAHTGVWYASGLDESGAGQGGIGFHGHYHFGGAGDVPVVADYNGDGIDDIAVWRPSTGQWFGVALDGGGNPTHGLGFHGVHFGGLPGDIPVPGDYNGDGITDIGIFRPSTGAWYGSLLDANGAGQGGAGFHGHYHFGGAGDVPVVADYNGDGIDDIAVWRPSTGQWFGVALDGGGNPTHGLGFHGMAFGGLAGDVPVPADYNGDGITDIGIYRPTSGEWFASACDSGGTTVGGIAFHGSAVDFAAPADPGSADAGYELALLDGGGVTLRFTDGQLEANGDGSFYIAGAVTIGIGDLRTTLAEAELDITLDGGWVSSLMGRARVQPSPLAAFEVADFGDLIEGRVGLAYGHQLDHLGAPLQPGTQYVYVDLEAGPDVALGPVGVAVGAGTTLVLDASDPMVFVEGRIEGLSELTVIEQAAVGLSAHGRIPLSAAHTWGLDGIETSMQGHLYTAGRFVVPRTPLTLDGEALLDLDPDDDGQTLFHGEPGVGLLFNGTAEVAVDFGPFPGFNVPVASASAGGHLTDDAAQVWYSGESGLDLADLLDGLPIVMHNQRYVAGLVSSNLADSFIAFGASAQLGDWDIADAMLHISPQGATLDARVQLHALTVTVSGAVDGGGYDLTGTGQLDLPVRAPKDVIETVLVPVHYTANSAMCSYDIGTTAAECGAAAALCTTEYITDAAVCGWTTIWSGICSLWGCDEPATCPQTTCTYHCEMPRSCTLDELQQRVVNVPDFDFGDLRGEISLRFDGGAPQTSASFEFCPTGGGCAAFSPTDFVADAARFRICGDIPGLGHHCIER